MTPWIQAILDASDETVRETLGGIVAVLYEDDGSPREATLEEVRAVLAEYGFAVQESGSLDAATYTLETAPPKAMSGRG